MAQHDKSFHMRLTQKEYDGLRADAKRTGLPLSTYMRFMMKGCRPKEQRPVDWFKFHRQLSAIGNNLNQIAHAYHRAGNVDAESYRQFYDDFCNFVTTMMDEMYCPEKLEKTKLVQAAREAQRQNHHKQLDSTD